MKPTPGSRIEFARIAPPNVARYYRLEIGTRQQSLSFASSASPVLTRAWGRLGRTPKEQHQTFASWELLQVEWTKQIAKRLARGYAVTRQTEGSTSSTSTRESAIR
jgi:predicted DNA-binding WGR domain protein